MQFFEKNLAKTNLWLLMIIVSRCSTLRPWVGYFIFYKLTSVFFQWTLLSSIKEVNRLLKETNRLLSKELSNIYLSVTIEKKWRTQNLDALSLKNSSPGQFLERVPTQADITEFPNFLLQLKSQGSESAFSIIFILKGVMTF